MSVNYIIYQLTLKENFLHCAIIDTKQFLEYKKCLRQPNHTDHDHRMK